MTVNRDVIKSWFKRGMKPLESQFANWIDSFFHKNDQIPINNISGLTEIVNNKYDKATGEQLSADLEAHKTDVEQKIEMLQEEIDNIGDIADMEEITNEEIDELI